ncbi:MAG: DUF1080 domain-containing protein, partial [Planctomycetota bacterium]|nr:DUF1080 domain-containing protein [Planctomycetota bacterium]
MMNLKSRCMILLTVSILSFQAISASELFRPEHIGVGAKPVEGAEVLLDGSRKLLDEKWTYWEGPRFGSSLPIKWKVVDDPVDQGTVVMTDDPAAAGGKFGAADIVTKQKFRDFRLHVEFW